MVNQPGSFAYNLTFAIVFKALANFSSLALSYTTYSYTDFLLSIMFFRQIADKFLTFKKFLCVIFVVTIFGVFYAINYH